VLEFASMYESTRFWGPKENVDPMELRERCCEPDGEGSRGGGIENGWFGGGVDAILQEERSAGWRRVHNKSRDHARRIQTPTDLS